MIISMLGSGLGNRLKCVLSSMRLDDDVQVFWPNNRFSGCRWNDLFENFSEIYDIPKDSKLVRDSERLLVLDSDEIPEGFAQEHPDKKFENGKLRKKIEVNNGQNIDHEYERIPEKIKLDYIEQAKKLVPAEYIRNRLEEFSSANFDENTVSVHMRSWADDSRRQCLFDFNNYFKYMDEMTDKKFFVCADHQHCIDVLKERYPLRVFDYPKQGDGNYSPGTSYMSTLEASQDAIIEMYLLGMNPIILGSYLSTFVEVGWYLGECKGKVIIV